ncbi:MAG TPA: DinB family protein [Thermomicrobiales bacterium]|nr:DinB family protein [Thermomicrobiales bacterium]
MTNGSSRSELIEQVDARWAEFLRALDAVPPDTWDMPGVCGYWSVGELVAHITYCDAFVPEYVQRSRLGVPLPPGGTDEEIDAENQEAAAASRFVSNNQLLRTLHMTHDQTARSLRDLDETVPTELRARIVGETSNHYPGHITQLQAWSAALQSPGTSYAAIVAGTLAMAEALAPERRDQPGVVDDWSARDLLTHLAYWDGIRILRLDVQAGRRDKMPAFVGDLDAINQQAMINAAQQSWDEVVAGAHETAGKLSRLLETESEFAFSPQIAEHWLEHVNDLRSALYDGLAHDH